MKRNLKPETIRTMAQCKLPLSEIVRLSGYSVSEVEAIVAEPLNDTEHDPEAEYEPLHD